MTKNRCENCDAPKGKPCPRWVTAEWGFMSKNDATSQYRPMVGCFYKVALEMMFEFARSMNSAARAVESSRNVIAEGFVNVAPVIAAAVLHGGNGKLLLGTAEDGPDYHDHTRLLDGPAKEQ